MIARRYITQCSVMTRANGRYNRYTRYATGRRRIHAAGIGVAGFRGDGVQKRDDRERLNRTRRFRCDAAAGLAAVLLSCSLHNAQSGAGCWLE